MVINVEFRFYIIDRKYLGKEYNKLRVKIKIIFLIVKL